MTSDESSVKSGNMHFHQKMEKHGDSRDAVHKFGGIWHAHDKPIKLDDDMWIPRQRESNEQ